MTARQASGGESGRAHGRVLEFHPDAAAYEHAPNEAPPDACRYRRLLLVGRAVGFRRRLGLLMFRVAVGVQGFDEHSGR